MFAGMPAEISGHSCFQHINLSFFKTLKFRRLGAILLIIRQQPEKLSVQIVKHPPNDQSKTAPRRKRRGGSFVERSLASLVSNAERALFAEDLARKNGLLQSLDPRVKIIGLLALILDVTLSRNFFTIIFIFAAAVLLAILSQIPIRTLATRAWLSAIAFTGTIALPVIFIADGEMRLLKLPLLNLDHHFEQGINERGFSCFCASKPTVTLSFLLIL